MQRLVSAYRNSVSAFRYSLAHEKAFQQEFTALLAAIPQAFILSGNASIRIMLIGSVFVVMIIEVLNTAVEAACDGFSRDLNEQIKIAKDCGSLAVLLSILLAAGIWGFSLWHWTFG